MRRAIALVLALALLGAGAWLWRAAQGARSAEPIAPEAPAARFAAAQSSRDGLAGASDNQPALASDTEPAHASNSELAFESPTRDALGKSFDPESDLLVRVLDASGRPVANVPVWLARRGRRRPFRACASGTSRPLDGLAVLAGGRRQFQPDCELALAAGAPLCALLVPIAAAPAPGEAAALALAPTRALELRCERSDGLSVRALITWSVEAAESADGFDELELPLTSARCTWPHAPIGHSLRVRARAPAYASADRCVELAGDASEAAELVLCLSRAWVALRGRALDEHGEPLAYWRIGWQRPAESASAAAAEASPVEAQRLAAQALSPVRGERVSDRDGRFEIRLEGEPAPGRDSLRLCARHGTRAPALRDVEFEFAAAQDSVELGSLRFHTADLLAKGRVLDARGAACSGVRVWAETVNCDAPQARRVCAWTLSGEDGGFELYGARVCEPLQLRAWKRSFRRSCALREPLPVPREPAELCLRVDGVRTLHVALQGVPESAIGAKLELRIAGPQELRIESHPLENGLEKIDELLDGEYELSVGWPGDPEPLARATVGLGEPGGAPEDAECCGVMIDLAPRLPRVQFQVTDSAGRALSRWRADLLDERGETLASRTLDTEGAVLCTRERAPDLRLAAPGCRTRVLRAVRDGDRFVLEPGPELVVHVCLPFDRQPEMGVYGRLSGASVEGPDLVGLGGHLGPIEWISAREGIVRVRAEGFGRCALELALYAGRKLPRKPIAQRTLELELVRDGQEVRVELEAAAAAAPESR